jgi:magnesium chelatase subunit H
MNATVFYVGSSLLAPLRQAERELNEQYQLGLRIAAINCTLPLNDTQWTEAQQELAESDIVFLIHVTDSENATRLAAALDQFHSRYHAVIVINCMPDLMRRMRLGQLDVWAYGRMGVSEKNRPHPHTPTRPHTRQALSLVRKLGGWMAGHAKTRTGKSRQTSPYLKFIQHVPTILRFVPSTGKLKDIKHYLTLFCYFMQPTPTNVRCMIAYAINHYVPGYSNRIKIDPPESRPSIGLYHPDAPSLFESFAQYQKWWEQRRSRFDPNQAIGLLLLRPQIVSGAHRHYDGLIHAIEAEGLPVLPVISTFMDNRDACQAFFLNDGDQSPRVAQIVSLTGFSFVGGPAMNDSQAAVGFLKNLNRPLRTAVSLDMQTVENWEESLIGLNPVQTAMQVAIPEIDGATEPFVYAGLPTGKDQPEPFEDRCRRIARRLARWNRLRTLPREETRLAFLIYCFPPNKGNLGTAADLDVFPSLWEILTRLKAEGYSVDVPENPDILRDKLLGIQPHSTTSDQRPATSDQLANVAYRLSVDQYFRLCPYVEEIEEEWGPAPGQINAQGRDILIHGIELGNLFIGIQPTFGYEGDPMRLLMAQGGAPHHGFMGLYTYVDRIFRADAVIHVGTHGALEFMPGKQVGLSSRCWPDRLIGEFPNVYIYSVNNPSEGSIAKRRSYAELISYLTPPIENAGLYKELATLKELLTAYRQTTDEHQREQLFAVITEKAQQLNLEFTRPQAVG